MTYESWAMSVDGQKIINEFREKERKEHEEFLKTKEGKEWAKNYKKECDRWVSSMMNGVKVSPSLFDYLKYIWKRN